MFQFADNWIVMQMEHVSSRFLDLWIAEAVKAAWAVWKNLGWSPLSQTRIEKHSWTSFDADCDTKDFINRIIGFNHCTTSDAITVQFEQAWKAA